MYAGLISSSFSFCQCITSLLWGSLSDRIGRKPVLLIGLFGNFVSMLLFGFSKNITWAITTRSISGFLSGNIGVAKCVLGEITDETNQNIAFAWYGLVFSVGSIIGPMVRQIKFRPKRLLTNQITRLAVFWQIPFVSIQVCLPVLNYLKIILTFYPV